MRVLHCLFTIPTHNSVCAVSIRMKKAVIPGPGAVAWPDQLHADSFGNKTYENKARQCGDGGHAHYLVTMEDAMQLAARAGGHAHCAASSAQAAGAAPHATAHNHYRQSMVLHPLQKPCPSQQVASAAQVSCAQVCGAGSTCLWQDKEQTQ